MIGFYLKITFQLSTLGELVIIIGFFTFIGVYGLSLGPVVWLYIEDIVQPSFVPYASSVNWGLDSLIVILFPLLINQVLRGEPQLLFLFFTLWCFLSFLFNMKFVVETKDKTEKEIQEEY